VPRPRLQQHDRSRQRRFCILSPPGRRRHLRSSHLVPLVPLGTTWLWMPSVDVVWKTSNSCARRRCGLAAWARLFRPTRRATHGEPGTRQPAEATGRASVGLGLAALWWKTRCAWCEGSCKLPPSRNQESEIRRPLHPSSIHCRQHSPTVWQNAHARWGADRCTTCLGP
jgi:hypothetical protein